MCSNAKNTLSELVLAAVFYTQQRNGVSVMQIAEYVAEKRCCNPCKIRGSIKSVLTKAKEHGIMCESRGLYRIEPKYEDKLDKNELKPKKDEEGDGNGMNGNGGPNDACMALEANGKANGKGNGEGPAPCCPQGADHDAHTQEEGDEDDEDDEDDDDEGEGTCPDDINDVEEPLPKKRKYDKSQEDYGGSDDDEEEEWAKCVEKKLWNLTKNN